MRVLRLSQFIALLVLVGGLAAIAWNAVGDPLVWTPAELSIAGMTMSIGLYVDLLAAILVAFVASIGVIVSTYARRNLRGQARLARFGSALCISYLALTLMITGASLPLVALGWMVSGFVLAVLVAHRGSANAVRAGRRVRRQLLVGDLLLVAGVAGVALAGAPLDRGQLGETALGGAPFVVAVLLLTAATMVRSALLPFNGWLPLTAEAPSPVSAYLHAGVVNAAGALVALWWPLFRDVPLALATLIVMGAVTAVVSTVVSKNRADVKGQLAASTSAQMGYMAIQLGLGLPAAAVLHLIGHGYYKSWTFLRAGGAVTRLRRVPALSAAHHAMAASLVAIVLVAAALVAARSPITGMVEALGVAALVPVIVATATAAVAVRAVVLRVGAVPVAVTAGVALAISGTLAGYLALLGLWDQMLSGALAETPVWGVAAATAWLALLALAAVGTVLAVRRTAARPESALAVAALSTSLPPAVRRTRGIASVSTAVDRPDPVVAEQLLRSAAQLVAPAFPLRSVVAANPLAGLEQLPFLAAAQVAERSAGARAFLPESEYLRLMQQGSISSQALDVALADFIAANGLDDAGLDRVRDEFFARVGQSDGPSEQTRMATLAQRRVGTGPWMPGEVAALYDSVWCARVWGRAAAAGDGELYARWRTAAGAGWGRSLGLASLAAALPEDPREALAELLGHSELPAEAWFEYLGRLLTASPGWAAHAAWREREGFADAVLELAVVRMAHDIAVGGPASGRAVAPAQEDAGVGLADQLVRRRIWQEAFEVTYRAGLASQVQRQVWAGAEPQEPVAQVLMCIDVRSERFRRHLEAAGPVQTFGFAGFFGAAVRYVSEYGQAYDQCPVLLQPTHRISARADRTRTAQFAGQQARRAAWDTPISAFGLAESTGVFAGVSSAVRTFRPGALHGHLARLEAPAQIEAASAADGLSGFTVEQLADVAESALRAIGLTRGFAPLIVIAGHAATVQNNAFAAAYDCGACGGNGGLQNARVLAHALNHTQVRDILADRGVVIPPQTTAVAALHNTTTDEFTLDGPVNGPAQAFLAMVEQAGAGAARERITDLPGAPVDAGSSAARRHVIARADDWAEACPEWGLAGNAAFVIGPRRLTAGLDLGGRVFLHSYEPDSDPGAKVLTTILTAPVVVAQWINSQYYFSTVDAEHFGSGDKSTHNVVGDVGVLAGAHGDIRVGLPWQALFADEADAASGLGRHVPMRLSVIAYADPAQILDIVLGSETLLRLVGNEWISVTAIDPATGAARRLHPSLQWQDSHEVSQAGVSVG